MASREMTPEEYQFALSIFERDFAVRDDIELTDGSGLDDRPFVRPTITGDPYKMYLGEWYAAPLDHRPQFAHELTHVWQLHHFPITWYGWNAFTDHVIGSDSGSYTYELVPGKNFGDYGLEEQGAIVEDAVRHPTSEAAALVAHTFKSLTWKLMIGSSGADIAVGNDGMEARAMWLLNDDGAIYRYAGDRWEQMPGSDGAAIGVGGGRVLLVNTDGKIYEFSGGAWTQLSGSDGRDIAVANDGTAWLANTDGELYTLAAGSAKWKRMPGSDASRIGAGQDVWLVNTEGELYRWGGSSWQQMPGSDGRDIAASDDGHVFLTNTQGEIYEYAGDAWTQLDGSDGRTLAAGGGVLALVNTGGRIYQRAYGATWTPIITAMPIDIGLIFGSDK